MPWIIATPPKLRILWSPSRFIRACAVTARRERSSFESCLSLQPSHYSLTKPYDIHLQATINVLIYSVQYFFKSVSLRLMSETQRLLPPSLYHFSNCETYWKKNFWAAQKASFGPLVKEASDKRELECIPKIVNVKYCQAAGRLLRTKGSWRMVFLFLVDVNWLSMIFHLCSYSWPKEGKDGRAISTQMGKEKYGWNFWVTSCYGQGGRKQFLEIQHS